MLRVPCLLLLLASALNPAAAGTSDIFEQWEQRQDQRWSAVFEWEKPTNVRACAIKAAPVSGPVRFETGRAEGYALVTMSSGGLWRKHMRFRLGYKPLELATYYVITGRHRLAVDRRDEFIDIDSPTVIDAVLDALSSGHALVIAELNGRTITAVEIYSPEGVDAAIRRVRMDCIF